MQELIKHSRRHSKVNELTSRVFISNLRHEPMKMAMLNSSAVVQPAEPKIFSVVKASSGVVGE
jgi:hypothetical protein